MNPNREFHDDDTAEMFLASSQFGPASSVSPASAMVKVDIAGLSHTGHVRTNNEDHYLVVRIERSMKTMITNLMDGSLPEHFDEVAYGMLVADGMGGSAGGEV